MAEQISTIIEDLQRLRPDYQCDPAIASQLSTKTLVPIIGPSAVGKTTIMRSLERDDTRFMRVRSFTTRPPRPHEAPETYHFLPHNLERLNWIHQAVAKRHLAQYEVHPYTGYVYGSLVGSYHREYPMLDAMSTALPPLEALPFAGIRRFFVVAAPDEYRQRINHLAATTSANEAHKRLREAADSITWALGRDDLQWIDNSRRDPQETSKEILHAIDEPVDSFVARRTGELLLADIRSIL